MHFLALETSGRSGSLALFESDERTGGLTLLSEGRFPDDQRTAQCLAPELQRAFSDAGWPVATLGLIAVTVGPGSFTGLRIGCTTAKTLAYATGAKLVGVSTLAVLAHQAGRLDGRTWSILDAQRGELFTQAYGAGDNLAIAPDAARICNVEEWIAQLQRGDAVVGPILARLRNQLPSEIETVDPILWQPTARAVGELGWRRYLAGHLDDAFQLIPRYHRRSAAEEKRRAVR